MMVFRGFVSQGLQMSWDKMLKIEKLWIILKNSMLFMPDLDKIGSINEQMVSHSSDTDRM